MLEKNTLSKEEETLILWLIFAVKMWVGSYKFLICEFSGQEKQRNLFSVWLLWTGENWHVHSASSQHEGIQAGGRSPEPLPPPKPTFLSPWAPGALLIYRNKTKSEDGGTSAEHSVSSGWRLSVKCLCLLSPVVAEIAPWSLLLWSRLSAQLSIFPKPLGKATPLDFCLSAKFYWKWVMIWRISRV